MTVGVFGPRPPSDQKEEIMATLHAHLGGVVEVGDKLADLLVASGGWFRVDDTQETPVKAPDSLADETNTHPEGEDTPEEDNEPQEPAEKQAPSAAQVRAWARDNGVKVPAKGRIPDAAYVAYNEAH